MFKGQQTPDDPNPRARKPKFTIPPGYAGEVAFLEEMRKDFQDDITFNKLNREAAIEDLRFLVGNHWDDITRQRREAARKPVITVNRLPAFVAQVLGSRRLNETEIKVVADLGGTEGVARIREDLMRSIQKNCRAEIAYNKALEGAVACGEGNFKCELKWNEDDVWNQDIVISPINDHMATVWDRTMADPTGRDARYCFVVDTLTKREFEHRFPWATPADVSVDTTLRGDLHMNGWITVDSVRIVEYWRMRSRKRILAMTTDGATHDITEAMSDPQQREQIMANVAQRRDGSPIMREVNKPYAERYLCSGTDILEGPYQLDIKRVPIFRVPGWEVQVGEWRHRWGLIRFLKDPQRLHNYSRSVVAEKMMQTPRNVWMAADTAVQGREAQWRQSHLTDDPLLVWNAESGQKPERIPPAQVESAWMEMAEVTSQDIKDVSNIHEANLGMPSNEVSGAAIVARQRVSDTGTIIYHDNLSRAIEECGRVINDLIPTAYDAPRILKLTGSDGKEYLQAVNAIGNTQSVDITQGKYAVSVITGPSYQTKRIEAAANMMNLANAMPEVLQTAADYIVEAQDWPMAQKIAMRLRKALPPGLLEPDEMTPQIQANAQQQAQQAATQQKMAMAEAQAKYMATMAQGQMDTARAQKYSADALAVGPKLRQSAISVASEAAARELTGHLEAIKTATGG